MRLGTVIKLMFARSETAHDALHQQHCSEVVSKIKHDGGKVMRVVNAKDEESAKVTLVYHGWTATPSALTTIKTYADGKKESSVGTFASNW